MNSDLADGRLVHVLTQCSETDSSFRIMWPSGKHFAAKLRVFIDFLSERLFPVDSVDS
jgi:DNA-binding transcriptional LysR family regulator